MRYENTRRYAMLQCYDSTKHKYFATRTSFGSYGSRAELPPSDITDQISRGDRGRRRSAVGKGFRPVERRTGRDTGVTSLRPPLTSCDGFSATGDAGFRGAETL